MGKQARLKKLRIDNTAALLGHYANVAGPVMECKLSDTRCLNATRITIEVCKRFEVNARPMVCHAMAINKIAWEYIDKHGEFPDFSKDNYPAGAWTCGVMGPNPYATNGYPHHLVALVQGRIVDAAAIQFNRPEKGISMPSTFIGPTTDAFLRGDRAVFYKRADDCVMSYKAMPDDRSYEGTPGFEASGHNLEIADAITTALLALMR
jgi:hypothetical protein